MSARRPNIHTIAPSSPFLETLADALLNGSLVPPAADGRPHPLASHLILLPTRRACRALTGILARRKADGATLLPRIRPIGDIDEAEIAFDDGGSAAAAAALALPPAIAPLRRQVLLTEMVLTWGRTVARELNVPGRNEPVAIPVRPGDAAMLARDLARLIDDFETEGRDFSTLRSLASEDHAAYWALTLEFLRIATEGWPRTLEQEGRLDAASRRDALLRAEAERLTLSPPSGPVIAAGSTGSIPASAELLGAVSRLPRGGMVLPGLDLNLDHAGWEAIDAPDAAHPGHPQYGLKRLLTRLGVSREEVSPLAPPARPMRDRLVSEAFRPAATTDRWAALGERLDATHLDGACEGLGIIEAADEQDEAMAIALALREAVETPGREAVLVTPDRSLARRVSLELQRWQVQVDDSAGIPLFDTAPGTLFRLVADVAANELAPVPLVALMQHPLAGFGLDRNEARRAARALELIVLRGVRPRAGGSGLAAAVKHRVEDDAEDHLHTTVRRLKAERGGEAAALAETICRIMEPLEQLGDDEGVSLAEIAAAHRAAFEAVIAHAGAPDLRDEARRALEDFLDDLELAASGDMTVTLDEYPALLGVLMADRMVRPLRPGHPRLHILGPLEARLITADLVILGGLNEGVWPADTRTDPFLNRPMRAEAGLEAPERMIGLSAHDAASLLSAPEVLASRAIKTGGEPTVASRWMQRLKAVMGHRRWEAAAARGARYLDWARRIDLSPESETPREPLPRPAVELRPQGLSVTEVETLIRDPYAIYARHVLGLAALDPLDAAPDAAERGTIVHAALHAFDAAVADGAVADPVATLMEIGETLFARLDDFPELRAVWWPRFRRVARWYAPIHVERRAGLAQSHAEIRGRTEFDIAGRPFRLRGRADRIDVTAEGGLVIVDYKTGRPPTQKEVSAGLAPQLPLEAAIARMGGFEAIPAGARIDGLTYFWLSGGQEAGRQCDIEPKETSVEALAEETLVRLRDMLTRFADPMTPYRTKTRVKQMRFAGDYDHLSRFAEWSTLAEGGEG